VYVSPETYKEWSERLAPTNAGWISWTHPTGATVAYSTWAQTTAYADGTKFSILLNQSEAHEFLSMSTNKSPEPDSYHSEGEGFLQWTAKELAIKMTFEWNEKEATRIFQGLKEPLASMVMHYLLKLRSVV
jgi:hypothetical protein